MVTFTWRGMAFEMRMGTSGAEYRYHGKLTPWMNVGETLANPDVSQSFCRGLMNVLCHVPIFSA